MNENEQTAIFQTLKLILKERNLTYYDLAQKLEMAESTVKRIFAIEECSLSKLISITQMLELDLFDLIQMSRDTKSKSYMLPIEIEQTLAENLQDFFFYKRLTHSETYSAFLKKEKIPKEELRKRIKFLDQLDLIERGSEDQIKFKYKGYLKLIDRGPLQSTIFRKWLPIMNEKIIDNFHEASNLIKLVSTQSTLKTHKTFVEDYLQIVEKYLLQAEQEQKVNPKKTEEFTVVLSIGKFPVEW